MRKTKTTVAPKVDTQNRELVEAIRALCQEKDLSEDMLFATVEDALKKAYAKNRAKGEAEPSANNISATIDRATGEVKGARPDPIVIGPHCWLGRECVFTKGAAIPHDTVVGIRAVVTKRFAEPHTALAGCPAKVVTTNLDWDGATPGKYLARSAR